MKNLFWGILQPCLQTGSFENHDGLIFDYLYDFTHIFDNSEEVYIDYVHVKEEGNELISNKILELMIDKGICSL